jgi:hypothetical protein
MLACYILTPLLLLALYLWCDAGEGETYVRKARGAINLVKLDNEHGEILACVLGVWWGLSQSDRILRWVLWATWASLARVTYGGYMWEVDRGVGYPRWRCYRGMGSRWSPFWEDIMFGPSKDWYVMRTKNMGPSCTPLALDGRGTITRLTRPVPLLLGWKVIV